MSESVLRAGYAWSAMPLLLKSAVLMAVLVALVLLGVSPALAGTDETNPFRWAGR